MDAMMTGRVAEKKKSICTAAAGKTWLDTHRKYAEREEKSDLISLTCQTLEPPKVIEANRKSDLFLMTGQYWKSGIWDYAN